MSDRYSCSRSAAVTADNLASTRVQAHGRRSARGGFPLIENGKIIGAIGCSGGTGSQDEAVCAVGAAMVK
jgi:uncharacterized protein GlcG (DUF336 family)